MRVFVGLCRLRLQSARPIGRATRPPSNADARRAPRVVPRETSAVETGGSVSVDARAVG